MWSTAPTFRQDSSQVADDLTSGASFTARSGEGRHCPGGSDRDVATDQGQFQFGVSGFGVPPGSAGPSEDRPSRSSRAIWDEYPAW
jgi:hypothetical protein